MVGLDRSAQDRPGIPLRNILVGRRSLRIKPSKTIERSVSNEFGSEAQGYLKEFMLSEWQKIAEFIKT